MLPPLPGQLLFFLATTSLLPSTASAATSEWLFPAYISNAAPVTFESQDTIDAAWTSEFVAPVLTLFCQINDTGHYITEFKSPAPVSPNGSYAVALDTVQDSDSRCHLNLIETNGPLVGTGDGSNSPNFVVIAQSFRSATTWSASAAAATTSSSTSTSESTPVTTSPPTSSPSSGPASAEPATATGKSITPHTNTSLSSGAKAGIGIGVALGVLALILAALLFWLRARRKQRRQQQQLPPPEPQKKEYGGTYASKGNDGTPSIPEMDGEYSGTYARGTHLVSEMNGRYPQEEKDGYPIASHRMVAELEGVSIR